MFTDRIHDIIVYGIMLIAFVCVMSGLSDNVSQVQLDTMFNCHLVYTEDEFRKNCRNELDGFGYYVDLSRSAH